MRAKRPFLIRAKPPLLDLLKDADEFYQNLGEDVIITVELSDRHGFDFGKIFDQIKNSYMLSISKSLPLIKLDHGFDYYWDFEPYKGCVMPFSDVLYGAGQTKRYTACGELNYLISLNLEDDTE